MNFLVQFTVLSFTPKRMKSQVSADALKSGNEVSEGIPQQTEMLGVQAQLDEIRPLLEAGLQEGTTW